MRIQNNNSPYFGAKLINNKIKIGAKVNKALNQYIENSTNDSNNGIIFQM